MARRYGGKYSPDATDARPPSSPNTYRGKRRARAAGRANFLFFAPVPLLLTAFAKPPVGMALTLSAFGILTLATWLTREGLRAEEAFEARRIARRPALPRKMIGSALTGFGLFVAGLSAGPDLLPPILYAGLGIVLHALAFGPDPLRDKGMEGVDTFQQDRVARAIDEAETHLTAMREAIARAGDPALERRVERFQATARDMFRTVENDPRDLTAARKYLGIYLLGARDATAKFADVYAHTRDAGARADYEALLDDLERNFSARTEKFLLNDRSDLDIEIDVLRERLAREGVVAR